MYKLQTYYPSRGEKSMKTTLRSQNFTILKIALNRVLTLPDCSTGLARLISCGILDFENKNISGVAKHWKYLISVPMSYITSVSYLAFQAF